MNRIELLNEVNEKIKGEIIPKITKPEKKLYSVDGLYFDAKKDIKDYRKENNISDDVLTYEIGYIRNIAGKTDVININCDDADCLVCAYDEDGYLTYDFEKLAWKYEFGNISDYYNNFRDRGIVFENDIYAKISKRYKKIVEIAR